MDEITPHIPSFPEVDWRHTALRAIRAPAAPIDCPVCRDQGVRAEWNIIDLMSQTAAVDLSCSACGVAKHLQIILPTGALSFFPLERIATVASIIEEQAEVIADRIQRHVRTMPAAIFTTHWLWSEAQWSATTFKWHPTSEAPPILGLVFENAEAGREIFRESERQMNHADTFEEIRVSIIEGAVPGQEHRPGYTVHLCPDPEALAAHATMDDLVLDPRIVPFLGQWNRMYPVPGEPAMLPRFKQEFARHGEFLLAPVTRHPDGQLYVDYQLGIIKNSILFRDLSEIAPEDPDAGAFVLPHLITPPESRRSRE